MTYKQVLIFFLYGTAVGRWQKNKDLSWYAKGDDSQKAVDAANARADEIRRIKEAEQDALSEALGFKAEPRLREHQLAGPKEVERAIKEAAEGDEEEGGKGLGFGGFVGAIAGGVGEEAGERMMGYLIGEQGGLDGGGGVQIGKKEKRRKRSKSRERRRRRGSIERKGERDERKQQDDEYGKSHKRHRSGERHHHHRRHRRSPSRSRSRSRQRGGERRREDIDGKARYKGGRERSYSPAAAQRQQEQPDIDQRRRSLYSSRHKRERSYSGRHQLADPEDSRPSRSSYRRERSGSPKLSDEKGFHPRDWRQRSYSPKKARRRDRSRDDVTRGRLSAG